MSYEILAIFWLLCIFFFSASLYCACPILHKRGQKPHQHVIVNIERHYKEADAFIYEIQPTISYGEFGGHYDYTYLRDWLAFHFAKYPNGKLPELSGIITYTALSGSTYSMNFYNAGDERIQKYIKSAMKLLKEKKPTKADILRQANEIMKAKYNLSERTMELVRVK